MYEYVGEWRGNGNTAALNVGNTLSLMNETFAVQGERIQPIHPSLKSFLGIALSDVDLFDLFMKDREKATEFFVLMEE